MALPRTSALMLRCWPLGRKSEAPNSKRFLIVPRLSNGTPLTYT